MTPNFFRLNYNSGRTHSGMIAYLAEMWEAGNQKPLQTLIEGLGMSAIPPGTSVTPKLEYNNIDLALLDKEGNPLLLLEMKVDDTESWKKLGTKDKEHFRKLPAAVRQRCFEGYDDTTEYIRQTELYTLRHDMALGDAPRCVFVTLGTGEYEKDFSSCGNVWKYCNLKTFVGAVKSIDLSDELFKQWRRSLEKEVSLREAAWNVIANQSMQKEAKKEADSGDRKGLLQLTRLGQLRRKLLDEHHIDKIGYRASVYKHGQQADTIMNFVVPEDGDPAGFRYCEINSNGKLNFKIYFHSREKAHAVKQRQVETFQQELAEIFGDELDSLDNASYGKSKTVAQLPIGLTKHTLLPHPDQSLSSIAAQIADTLTRAKALFPSLKHQSN